MLRAAAIALLALALSASPASAATKTFRVDDVKRWVTPQKFGRDDTVIVRVFIRGREAEYAYANGDTDGWAWAGVLVECRSFKRRAPLRFTIANVRKRDATVKIVYWSR